MEESIQGEDVLPDYPSYGTSKNSPRTTRKSAGNPGFDDVFGGPPRRFSLQEVRVRFSFSEQGGIPAPLSARMIGEEKPARRRFLRDDFFDDIFRGDESSCSPRTPHPDQDFACGSNPSSRITSPAPNPSAVIPSLPTQLSLPANASKSMEFANLVPENHGQFKSDSTGNRLNSPHSSSSSSRYYHPSPLASFSSEDSSSTGTYDNFIRKPEKHVGNMEFPMYDNQFHFSIHKWAGKGIPMLAPVYSGTFRDTGRSCRFARSDGKIEGDFAERKASIKVNQGLLVDVELESSRVSCEKKVYGVKEDRGEPQCSTEEAIYDDLVCEWLAGKHTEAKKVKSVEKIDYRKKVKNKVPLNSEMKHLRTFLTDMVKKSETKKSENIGPVGDGATVQDRRNVKKDDETGGDSKIEAVKAPKSSDKFDVKEKIKGFVQIFNHEARSGPRPSVHTQNQCCEGQGAVIDEKGSEVHLNVAKVKEQVNSHTVVAKPHVSVKVDEHPNEGEGPLKAQMKAPSFRNSFHRNSKVSVEISDDPSEDYFLVEELSSDPEKVAASDDDPEKIKALDAQIQQWSAGKRGNIRSLLSTLQFVLWPGNGWKPVPLVDLIETNAVKRAYQKALLRLHPDKLQQNGAAFHQKYIAEKVFDILQGAWDQFNLLAPL